MTSTTFFFVFVPIIAILFLVINLLLAPHNSYAEKDSVFECGFHSFLGQNRTQFTISFFLFGFLFLLFDLEILLAYPYVVSAYTNGIYGLVMVLVFFCALTLGFVFELGKNALKIDSKQVSNVNNKTRVSPLYYNNSNTDHKALSVIRFRPGMKPMFVIRFEKSSDWLKQPANFRQEIISRINIDKNNSGFIAFYPEHMPNHYKAFEVISRMLVEANPDKYKLMDNDSVIMDCVNNKKYSLNSGNPFKAILELLTQDINILWKCPEKKEFILIATLTMYPVFWVGKDRLGWTLSMLHALVPDWEHREKAGAMAVFNKISSKKYDIMHRTNAFIQVGKNLAMFNREIYRNILNNLFNFTDLYLRREYQVFTYVSKDLIIFTVETHLEPLSSLSLDELDFLYSHFHKMEENRRQYHDFYSWGPVLKQYLDEKKRSI